MLHQISKLEIAEIKSFNALYVKKQMADSIIWHGSGVCLYCNLENVDKVGNGLCLANLLYDH